MEPAIIGMTAVIGVIVSLFAIIANHRLSLWRTRRNEYRSDYAAFCEAFSHTISQLKSGDTTLNLLVLGEFPRHEAAADKFIVCLPGNQRSRFQEKFNEYRNIYLFLKELGEPWMAAAVAIAPSEETLENHTPGDADKWEHDRSNELYNLIHELLEISKIKKWL